MVRDIETSLGASTVKATASERFLDDALATPFATTVANVQPSSGDSAAQATETPSTIPTISSVPSTNANSEAATVAGGVLSGLVVLSFVGLFFWLWRRRRLQKRRNTLLTPLGPGSGLDQSEKPPYITIRRGMALTPVFEKAKAALDDNVRKIRERITQAFSEERIRLPTSTRPQSQGLLSSHSRNPSLALTNEGEGTGSVKDRILNWWCRITSSVPVNKRLRNEEAMRETDPDQESTSERKTGLQYQPDFLTLLAMDDRDLGREPQRQQRRGVPRPETGSRDNSTLSHISAIPAPLAGTSRSNSDNSFNDPVPRPPTKTAYRTDDRHRHRQSRGQSISVSTTTSASAGVTANPNPTQQPSTRNPSRQPSTRTYRESIDSFTTHRNKFRSDPFDLEGTAAAAATATGPRHPPSAHTRQESLGGGGGSSRYSYSSGVVSLDDKWSDPGPDVGTVGAGGYSRVRGGSVSTSASVSGGRSGRKMSVGRVM